MLLGLFFILILAINTPCGTGQTAVIKGRIVASNGASAGAKILFYPQNAESCSTMADSMGVFRQVVPSGKVSVFAYTKEGFAIAKKSFDLPPFEVVTHNMLWHPGWVKGKVLGIEDKDLEKAKVCAYPLRIQGYCSETDKDGLYKLAVQKGKTAIKVFLNTGEIVHESRVQIIPGMILVKDFSSGRVLKEPRWRINVRPSGKVVLEALKEQFNKKTLKNIRFEWHLKNKSHKSLEYFIKDNPVYLDNIIRGEYEAVLYIMHKKSGRQSVAFEFTTPSSSPSYRKEGVLEALNLIQYLLKTPVEERVNGQIPWFSTTNSEEMDKIVQDIAARLKYPIGLSKNEEK